MAWVSLRERGEDGGIVARREEWIPVKEAAERLGVAAEAIHRRAPLHVERRRLGDEVCARESDVEQWEKSGLPHAHMEALEAGELLPIPASWHLHTPHGHGPHAYIALKPLTMGPHPARRLQAGDIISAELGAGSPLDRMVGSGEVAALPIDRGLLALVRVLLERESQLEHALALQAARAEARNGNRYLADRLIELGLIREEQFQAARAFHAEPDEIPVNTDEWATASERREREWIEAEHEPTPELRTRKVKRS